MYRGWCFFFFQAEDGIRDLVRSRGLGDVYKRQEYLDAIQKAGFRDIKVRSEKSFAMAEADPRLAGLSLIHI